MFDGVIAVWRALAVVLAVGGLARDYFEDDPGRLDDGRI
jgi:hypothetical protein